MTAFPIAINGDAISALVVGGGRVATRKAMALLAAGAKVTIVAPRISDELSVRERADANLTLFARDYAGPADIADCALVIAATASRDVNERVAADARSAHRLVNVVDAPATGSFTTMAVHRSGDIVIGVSTGSVPPAATRIRDSIATRIDSRYANAIAECAAIRSQMLDRGRNGSANGDEHGLDDSVDDAIGGSPADSWGALHPRLISPDFCASIEDGTFAARAAGCR